MQYFSRYQSPLGGILLAADAKGLAGLWFDGQKYKPVLPDSVSQESSCPVLEETKEWLAVYFAGHEPDFMPAIHMTGSSFQLSVWSALRKIPYGQTMTYGQLAGQIAAQQGLSRGSAQATGGAAARNQISILIPCHRLIGADGRLTGYAGGIDRKKALLQLEGIQSELLGHK